MPDTPQEYNDGAQRRSDKLTTLLRSCEDYINEVVRINHATTTDEITKIAKDEIMRSLIANVDYHLDMAAHLERSGYPDNATYHKVIAQVYASL